MTTPTALIADDEPLLREVLQGMLALQWPELRVVAQARNGLEAIERFEADRPAVCFLDIHMPGLTGIEVARRIGGRAHIVFITAFDHYALEAFEQGALDYLVKPMQAPRLSATATYACASSLRQPSFPSPGTRCSGRRSSSVKHLAATPSL